MVRYFGTHFDLVHAGKHAHERTIMIDPATNQEYSEAVARTFLNMVGFNMCGT